ncbi:MAG TPA: efflux RND transporter periplasmic adaptor subunit [Hellea balneolensis]|uniref:Efflux RND transporter periplasmic adaptor subunit n=1 Tax=Hellea balneolensis TaxID=287478 RepID=A0A7C5LSE3_9PROT|nr:efflux RND transporter periplasmic adaptor subunit [Hellea balneolensis]
MVETQIDPTEQNQPSLMRKVLVIMVPILILLAAILLVVILTHLKKKPEVKKKKTPVFAVLATPAYSDDVQLVVSVQGEARPRTEIDLVPEVAGKIIYVSPKFLAGGVFKKGDVLYKIDPADYQVAVVRAEAAVARAKQALVREQAEGDIARRDWEDLGKGEASDLTLRKPQLLEAKANLQSAQADLENAKIRLGRTLVKAPFDGRVREKFADIGQYVNPGSRLGRIFASDILEVRLALSDADLSKLDLPVAYVAKTRKDAPQVKIRSLIAGQERVWNGQIMRTESTFDTQTRSLYAIAEVVDPYGKGMSEGRYPLAPGLYVNADIKGKSLENVIVIPRDGLRPEDKVYIVEEDGNAQSRDVVVLDATPARAVLAKGIEAGDIVVLSPLEKSQLTLKLKALDVDDPAKVLVEPKIEEEDDDAEVAAGKKKNKKKKGKKKGKSKGGKGQSAKGEK